MRYVRIINEICKDEMRKLCETTVLMRFLCIKTHIMRIVNVIIAHIM